VFFRVAGPMARPEIRENDMTATSISASGPATGSSGRTIVKLREALDIDAAPQLRERLIGVLGRGAGLLVLDLQDVPSCDVVGLAVLIGTQRRARHLGIEVRLAAPSPAVAKVLSSTGLYRSFTICPDASGALATELDHMASPAPVPAGPAAPGPRAPLASGIAV
jgi:anti-anti-sigma factor